MTDTRWGRGVALPPMLQLRPRPIEHLFISRQSKTLSCLLSYYSSMHSLSFLHASLQRKMPYKFYRFARDGFLLLVLRETERTTVLRYLNCKPRDSHCRSITFSGSRRRILPPFLPSAQPTAGTENANHFPSTWRLTVMTRAHVSAAVLNWALMGLWARLIWIRNLRPNVCQIYQILYIR